MTTERIITPEFRACFVALFRPTGFKNADGTTGKLSYSIKAAFPPNTDLKQLMAQAQRVATDKWGNNIPKNLHSPFRINEEMDNPVVGIGDDWIIMTFSANEDKFTPKSNLVDEHNNGIMDEVEAYSGAWYRAQVQAYDWEFAGKKGISFGLRNVQKLRDDDPIGGGNGPANKAFEAVGGPAGKAEFAGDLFK
jgi:hypothetical protein